VIAVAAIIASGNFTRYCFLILIVSCIIDLFTPITVEDAIKTSYLLISIGSGGFQLCSSISTIKEITLSVSAI